MDCHEPEGREICSLHRNESPELNGRKVLRLGGGESPKLYGRKSHSRGWGKIPKLGVRIISDLVGDKGPGQGTSKVVN